MNGEEGIDGFEVSRGTRGRTTGVEKTRRERRIDPEFDWVQPDGGWRIWAGRDAPEVSGKEGTGDAVEGHDETLGEVGVGSQAFSYQQQLWSLGFETEWRFGSSDLTTVTLGAAYDGANTPESGDKPPREAISDYGACRGALLCGVRALGAGRIRHYSASTAR